MIKDLLLSSRDMIVYDFMGTLCSMADLEWAKSLLSQLSQDDKNLILKDFEG